jgi:hypothetical protein
VSRSKPSGQSRELGEVYTLHFVPKLGHAGHYTGWARPGRTPNRLIKHFLGRGARITQVQREAGGSWVLADVKPGTRDREQQLKERGRSRDCTVCKAGRAYKASELSAEQALKAAGWDRATRHEKKLLAQALGIPEVPGPLAADLAKSDLEPGKPIEQKWPQPMERVTPEMEALADGLIAGWRAELDMPQMPGPEREYELEAG